MKNLWHRLKRSLTGRLLILFIIVSLFLEVLLVVTLMHGFAKQWRGNIRPHLENYLDYVNADIGYPPSIEVAQDIADRLPITIYIQGPDTNFSSSGETLNLEDIEFQGRRSRHFERNLRHSIEDEDDATSPSKKRDSRLSDSVEIGDHRDRTVLVNTIGDYKVYYELRHAGRRQHREGFVLLALCCLVGILGVCYLLLRRMLRPVRDIKIGVQRMGEGQLDYRVPIRADNDLGILAGSINTMASDIEQMLDAKRQLLLGASHELRSPLTRAKVATRLLDESPNRNRIEADLDEMEMLIADILESERMKAGHTVLDREAVKLDELTQSVLRELSADRTITLDYGSNIPEILVDKTRMRLMLRNLLSNAITYSSDAPAPPSIAIRLDTLQDCAPSVVDAFTNQATSHQSIKLNQEILIIEISDTGPGIAAEFLHKITEPFFRPDASRARKTGGFGLGLHLAKLIAQAHGGHLLIQSVVATPSDGSSQVRGSNQPRQSGTTVTVAMPFQPGH